MPQYVLQDDNRVAEAEGRGGLDKIFLLQGLYLSLYKQHHDRNVGNADYYHDYVYVRFERGHRQKYYYQPREGIRQVGEIGDHRIHETAPIARQHAKKGAEYERYGNGKEPWQEIRLDAQYQS